MNAIDIIGIRYFKWNIVCLYWSVIYLTNLSVLYNGFEFGGKCACVSPESLQQEALEGLIVVVAYLLLVPSNRTSCDRSSCSVADSIPWDYDFYLDGYTHTTAWWSLFWAGCLKMWSELLRCLAVPRATDYTIISLCWFSCWIAFPSSFSALCSFVIFIAHSITFMTGSKVDNPDSSMHGLHWLSTWDI